MRRLCDYVLELAPRFEGARLAKPTVYRFVFEAENYQELRLNNVISDLLQLLYDFLGQLSYEKDEARRRSDQLEGLLEREVHNHIPRLARRYEQLLARRPTRSYQHYYHAYQYYDKLDRLSLTRGKRGYDASLQHQSDQLDLYYCCNKLRMACDMQSRNRVVNAGYQAAFLEELLPAFRESPALQKEPPLQVYYRAYRMLTEPGVDQHYFDLRALLQQHSSLFPRRELRILYNYALNHCVRRINSGQSRYYREIFELYQVLLKEQVILRNGYLTQWSYINIITAGIRLK